ncbi:MAG: thioredoxin family protein [Cyanobacteriota bacterium]
MADGVYLKGQGIVNLSDDTSLLKAVAESPVLLLDVWAAWCGPCRLMAKVMDWAAVTYGERLVVAKLNADDSPDAVERLGVQGLPTLILYKDGQEVARHEGAVPPAQLQAFLDSYV